MGELLQVILINLAVSFDNVGVIALATRNLPADRAKLARRVGIGLSVLLRLLFIGVTGLLFDVPWLHIRIVGGAMLLYVTWSMLHHQSAPKASSKRAPDSFTSVLVSIVAADVSMSLDNVLAILAILSVDDGDIGRRDLLIILAGLLACVPVLLWFSGTVSRLMERFAVITYLCAGYLVYIAVHMIFQDATIALFFEKINFRFATQAAMLCGGLVVISSLFTGGAPTPDQRKRRRAMGIPYLLVAAYAFLTVGVLSFLSSNPVVDGIQLGLGLLGDFQPSGAGAVYILGASSHFLLLCFSIFLGRLMDGGGSRLPMEGYFPRLGWALTGMAVFVGMELGICTVGLWVTFGFGSTPILAWLANLVMQLLLHATYASVFCMIAVFARHRVATIALSMLFVHLESSLFEVFFFHRQWMFAASFLPTYYIHTLSSWTVSAGLFVRVVLVSALYIAGAAWVGSGYCQRRERLAFRNTAKRRAA